MNRALSRRGILSLAALLPALTLTFVTLVAGSRPAVADGVTPEVGKPAPAFKLQDQAGKWHTLADLQILLISVRKQNQHLFGHLHRLSL